MEWHIVTSSKGGVGKTLLTLLLLAYHLEEKTNEGILVFDLNLMNTDTSALLLYGKTFAKQITIELKPSGRLITLQKTYSQTDSQNSYFAVGWSENPFFLYQYDDFVELLSCLKKHAENIAEELEIKPLKHVIIDTNHHFCNLFPPQDENYGKYSDIFETDNITIWFLWVYRQLKKLLDKNDRETQTINQTAGAIERILKQLNPEKLGPLVHTYTPVGLPIHSDTGNNLLSRLFGGNSNQTDHVIKELMRLEKLKEVGHYVEFNKWLEKLQESKIDLSNHPDRRGLQEDTHQFFGELLSEAVQKLVGDDLLPLNIFPLSVYQPTLEGYTDKERIDAVANLRKLDTYKNFKKLLNRKLRNFPE